MNRRKVVGLLLTVAAASMYAGMAEAAVWYVKTGATGLANGTSWTDAYTTIQAGVTAASSGDEVWVAAGTYTGTSSPIVAMKDGVALYGGFAGTESTRGARNYSTNVTIIAGAGAYRCVEGANNITLDGFTIRNGQCAIYGTGGAGLSCTSCSGCVIANCIFTGNSNVAEIDAFGGAVCVDSSSATFTNCVFTGNSTSGQMHLLGGALFIRLSSGVLTNCTFTGNSATGIGDVAVGGAVAVLESSLTMTNVIAWNDTADAHNEIYSNNSNVTIILTHSCIQGGWGGDGNINADPLFVDGTDGGDGFDLRLQATSPCINAGTDTSSTVPASASDMVGVTRPQGAGYDMGAYERPLPTAAFSASPTSGMVPVNVSFTDASTTSVGTITSWAWTFGDGSTSAEQNPTHTYSTAGVYSVSLSATSPLGTDTLTKVNYVTIDPVTASFSSSSSGGPVPLAVTFTDTTAVSSGAPISSWAWAFGDGGTSTEQNPTHTYIAVGVYDVSLTVTTAYETSTATQTNCVTTSPGTAVITTWPTGSAITYGQSLASSTLGGAVNPTDGTFTFFDTSIVPSAGTFYATAVFTPTDLTGYSVVYGVVSVPVTKAAPNVSAWPTATEISYGDALNRSTLSGGTADVAGTFVFAHPELKPGAGMHMADVTFSPTDAVDYATVSGTVNVMVNPSTPTITTLPTATGITYGQTLTSSYLLGGQAWFGSTAVAGSFAFAYPTAKPDSAGPYPAAITFTPAEETNYNAASGTVSVTVAAADCPDCVESTGPYTAGGTACLVVPGTFDSSTAFVWSREDNAPLDTSRITGIYCQRLQIANLKQSDAGTYVCAYSDTAKGGTYTVTITVNAASEMPAMPHGAGLIAVVSLFGSLAAWRYRRHATNQ